MTGKWTSLLLGVSRETYYVESLLIIEKSVHTLQMQAAATVTLLCHRGEKPLHFSRCRRRPVFTPVEWQGWSGTRNMTKRQAPLSRSWQLIEKPDKLGEQRRSALRKRSSALPFWGQGGYARLLPSGPCWICSSHGLLSNTHTRTPSQPRALSSMGSCLFPLCRACRNESREDSLSLPCRSIGSAC